MDSRVIIAIVIVFILCGCEHFPSPYYYDLTVVNNTDTSMAVCVYVGTDTLVSDCYLEYPLDKRDTRNLMIPKGPWSEVITQAGGAVFYFYLRQYMGKSDSVRITHVLVQKCYTPKELDSLDWIVTYP